jgi:hypothetical protein
LRKNIGGDIRIFHEIIQGMTTLGRNISQCGGPKVGTYLVYSRNNGQDCLNAAK